MQRGVRADLKNNRSKDKLKRSKSKSRSPSPSRKNPKNKNKKVARSADRNKRNRSPSIARSRSKQKKKIGKSQSNRKLQRSNSQPKVDRSPNNKVSIDRVNSGKNNKSILRSPDRKVGKSAMQNSRKNEPIIKQEQKDMGLIFYQPDHEKVTLKVIDALDSVHEKYLEMISNDNDASYVMNALPEFRDIRKEDDSSGRDFISGKITRLSGVFENLSVDKIMNPLKKVPLYYNGNCGKSLLCLKVGLLTKFKVQVDLGFLQYSLDGDKITIFRIYISKIYRRMNYIAWAYLEMLKLLMEKHPAADRWSIFVLERNQSVHKFFKFIGMKIDKIITDSKVKSQVEYYQEFGIKKKELQTAIASFK